MTKEDFLQKFTDSGNVGGDVLRLCKSKYPYNGQPK